MCDSLLLIFILHFFYGKILERLKIERRPS
uniref:Uncharacterized protein n=1 Tax=Anguilla anguilla TaxID=7936 RepID=A0A0E9UUK7_ANGAN